ncbi:hypothetical protein ACFVVA_39975 [Kitasatospora sp. NPDC058048]|uniref:effector-associated constant component EACC1 n=1 Tax=Kitasatospora sp. NPDC058048 TaxID=3346313 RepID=UPI0036DE4C14
MRIVITVRSDEPDGRAVGANDIHGLRRWLAETPALRGRVGRDVGPAEPGSMGAVTEALLALLEPGGVASVFAGTVVAWVQTRRGSHTITITRPDGSRISLSTSHVKKLTPEQITLLTRDLAAALDPPSPSADSEEASTGPAQ